MRWRKFEKKVISTNKLLKNILLKNIMIICNILFVEPCKMEVGNK